MISKDKERCITWAKDNLNFIIESELGSGADGIVYSITSDKVIKFSVLYDYDNNIDFVLQRIYNVFNSLLINNYNIFAIIYKHGLILKSVRKTLNGEQNYAIHYYIMEKLNKLSEDEKKVFHSILSHEDRGIEKRFSDKSLKKILRGLRTGLDFDEEKIIIFYRQVWNCPLKQTDVHARNIMKDNKGNFKFIDLDRVELFA